MITLLFSQLSDIAINNNAAYGVMTFEFFIEVIILGSALYLEGSTK